MKKLSPVAQAQAQAALDAVAERLLKDGYRQLADGRLQKQA